MAEHYLTQDLKGLALFQKTIQHYRQLLASQAQNIEILYGESGDGQYYLQFVTEDPEQDDRWYGIADGLSSFHQAETLGHYFSTLFSIPLVKF